MGGNSGLFLLQQKRRVGPQDLAVLEKEEVCFCLVPHKSTQNPSLDVFAQVNWENLVRSGRDVHHVILTVFTNLGPTSIALETQLYRPSLVSPP